MTRTSRPGRPAAFTDAEVEAGFWLVLAHVLGVDRPPVPDGWEDEGGEGVPEAFPLELPGSLPDARRAQVRHDLGVARGAALADPSLTLSVADHDRARLEVLESLGQVSRRGTPLWPVGSRTVSARLGGGSWSAALVRLGLAAPVTVRPRGNLRFDEDDFRLVVREFLGECSRTGTGATFSAYTAWCAGQREQGREVPAGATLRQHFGSWSAALAALGTD